MPRDERWAAAGVHGATVWLTGLSGSGKSTVAGALAHAARRRRACSRYTLDGDNLRHGLNGDLGFSADDRDRERAPGRRGGAAVRRRRRRRARARSSARTAPGATTPARCTRPPGLPFVEVFVDTPLEVCEQRDPKGLYAKARAGELTGFTGIDDPYEAPLTPELVVRGGEVTARAAALTVVTSLAERGVLSAT